MKLLSKFLVLTIILFGIAAGAQAKGGQPIATKHQQTAHQSASININKASVKMLMTLKGIGPRKAKAIVAYRKQHGAFASIQGLTKVKGIGKKRLARLIKNNKGRMRVQ